MKCVKGFTLIELMVALALAGILAALALPSFRNLIVSTRLDSAASDVTALINYARSESIKRNVNVRFCRASSATATACAGSSGNWQFWIVLGNSNVLRRGIFDIHNGDLQFTSNLTNDEVVFGGDGLARSGSNIVAESQFLICSVDGPAESVREVEFGAASRVSINKLAGVCP